MTAPTALSPIRRRSDAERLRDEHFDVLVIGGGVDGTGIALDAATRGLSVGLVEQRDLASGWDRDAIDRGVEHDVSRVEAERQNQAMPDDHTADAARLGAPDVRIGFRPVG